MSFILSVVWNGMPAPEEPASADRERMDAISRALARRIQRQQDSRDRSRESQCVAYAAGHLVMLWALVLECAGWAGRSGDPKDVTNAVSIGISIFMAIYASALIVAGVALRSALNRILGLGLFALAIVKWYLLDVWSLSRGFRITAFLPLGGLLLLVSYLYSRFKPALERLWRAEATEQEAPPENPSAGERSSI